jgi:hypothetical protein
MARSGAAAVRRRGIQLGLVVVAVALVVVTDAIADRLLVLTGGAAGQRLHALLLLGGRVVAGWSVGLAFRLQLAPRARTDEQLRLWLGAPLGFVCAWPLLLSLLPVGLIRLLPGWATTGAALEVQPLTAVLFGLVLALSVTRSR